MVLEDVGSQSDAARAVTPMSEIRQHKGMRLEEYVELYPRWADWMRNSDELMYDAEGEAWVARWGSRVRCCDWRRRRRRVHAGGRGSASAGIGTGDGERSGRELRLLP